MTNFLEWTKETQNRYFARKGPAYAIVFHSVSKSGHMEANTIVRGHRYRFESPPFVGPNAIEEAKALAEERIRIYLEFVSF